MSIGKKHWVNKRTRHPLHSIIYVFVLILSGLMMFWLAPALANQKSDSLLLAAIALFTLGLILAFLSLVQISIFIKEIVENTSEKNNDN